MDAKKRKRLEADGWRIGSAAEFLGLSDAESALVDIRLSLAGALTARRQRLRITQVSLAKRLQSSQSRVAKMEAGNPTVSFELLMRALLVLGASRRELSAVIR